MGTGIVDEDAGWDTHAEVQERWINVPIGILCIGCSLAVGARLLWFTCLE